jgi:hypothetical protein
VRASKAIPSWWTELTNVKHPVFMDDPRKHLNMKTCTGFLELYKRGAIIEHWCDINVCVSEDEGYSYHLSGGAKPSEHASHQYQNGFKNYYHMKLASPWRLQEKTGVKFLFTGAQWSLEDYSFMIVPGVVDYNAMTNASEVNMMIPKGNYSYSIPIGKPLVHLIPLTEGVNLKVKNHLITAEEMQHKFPFSHHFGGDKTKNILRKRNEERQKSKCPFHF